jgi:hypothetical protein
VKTALSDRQAHAVEARAPLRPRRPAAARARAPPRPIPRPGAANEARGRSVQFEHPNVNMSTLERQLGSMASLSSTSSTLSFDEDLVDADGVPQLPLRRREGDLRRAGAREEQKRKTSSTSVKWFSTLSTHPLVGALGAFLTIVLPPRVASSLSQYASGLRLAGDDDEDDEHPSALPTGGESHNGGYGFYVAITPPAPGYGSPRADSFLPPGLLLGAAASPASTSASTPPTAETSPSSYRTNGGSTPPLIAYAPRDADPADELDAVPAL